MAGRPASLSGIADGREYTPQHFRLEAFREIPQTKNGLNCKRVSTNFLGNSDGAASAGHQGLNPYLSWSPDVAAEAATHKTYS
jgi:hypothetical protein